MSKFCVGLGVFFIVVFDALSISAAERRVQAGSMEHRDILIARTDDRLVVGTFTWGSRHIELPVSVHWGRFDQEGEGWAMSSRPGFNGLQELPAPYQALSAAQELRIAIRSVPQLSGNLGYWSGTGPVQFQAPLHGETLSLVHTLTRDEIQFGGEDASVPGFTVGSTGQGGVLHEHHEFVLKSGQDLQSSSPGLYAFAMQMEMDELMPSGLVVILLQWGEVPPDAVSRAMTWLNQEFPAEGENPSSSAGCRMGAKNQGSELWLCLIFLFLARCRQSKVNRKS